MSSSRFQTLLFRYLLFVGIPYLIARHIEKYVLIPAKKERALQKKKLPDSVSEHTKNGLDNRGGFVDPILLWVTNVLFSDMALKVAIAGSIGSSIWSETADNAAAQLAKYGSAILAVPGKKFIRLYTRIRGIDPRHSQDIRKILLDAELSKQNKLELLKIKISSVLKNLTGSKRKQFILCVIAMLVFCLGGNFSLFAWFIERLRALIGTDDDTDTILKYIIEEYREFNAPLPEELAETLPEEILNSIYSSGML